MQKSTRSSNYGFGHQSAVHSSLFSSILRPAALDTARDFRFAWDFVRLMHGVGTGAIFCLFPPRLHSHSAPRWCGGLYDSKRKIWSRGLGRLWEVGGSMHPFAFIFMAFYLRPFTFPGASYYTLPPFFQPTFSTLSASITTGPLLSWLERYERRSSSKKCTISVITSRGACAS